MRMLHGSRRVCRPQGDGPANIRLIVDRRSTHTVLVSLLAALSAAVFGALGAYLVVRWFGGADVPTVVYEVVVPVGAIVVGVGVFVWVRAGLIERSGRS